MRVGGREVREGENNNYYKHHNGTIFYLSLLFSLRHSFFRLNNVNKSTIEPLIKASPL